MRIAIDARYVHTTDCEVVPAGGVGRYAFELIRNLLALDADLHLTLIVPAGNVRPVVETGLRGRVREIPYAAPPHSLRTLFRLSRQIRLDGVDVFHSPFNVLPRGLSCPAVTTVHDMMWLAAPELAASFWPKRLLTGSYYRYGIGRALRHSAQLLTVSEASREAILHAFPDLRGRVTVTHNGVGSEFGPMSSVEAEQATAPLLPLGSEFVLCVGQGSPYKNHLRAIEAFMLAFADQPNVRLVLVRRFSRLDRAMNRMLAQKTARERLVLLPEVSQAQLHGLYCRARALLFPSLMEGFGLPLIEAMACGTPVVTSDRGAMKEIVGDAAMLVDPHSVASIAEGLRRLDREPALRGALIANGRARAKEFSWRRTAEKTLEVYRRAVASSKAASG